MNNEIIKNYADNKAKRILSITLSLILILALSSCNKASDMVNSTTETAIPIAEYKTIPPPEDGWTLELLNEVTYINGKDIDLPFCLDDLGEEFTVENVVVSQNDSCRGDICYKGKFMFTASSSTAGSDFERNDEIDFFVLGLKDNESSLELSDFFSINGVSMSSSMNILYKNLGIDFLRDKRNNIDEGLIVPPVVGYVFGKSTNSVSFTFNIPFIETDTNTQPVMITIDIQERD
jgi:hypothetical protein